MGIDEVGPARSVLVFTATYNEADNIAALVDGVLGQLPRCDMLVVDDNSPDGTGAILDQLAARTPRLRVIHRPAKNGLGSAHKLGMKYALAHGYQALVTMDADFSHDPVYLPEIVRHLAEAEFVIGSRFAPGGTCEYPMSRVVLSRTANTMARRLLGIPVHETTTSYRGFRRSLLERMDIDAIRADGYSFFVESIFQVSRIAGPAAMAEFPIRFADRRAGTTKISKKEIFRGITTLARLAGQRAVGAERLRTAPQAAVPSEDLIPCNACGSPYHVEEYPASTRGHASTAYNCTSTEHGSHGRIVQCLACGLVYTNPQLTKADVLSLYSNVEDKTYLDNVEARVDTFTYNLNAIAALLPASGRMLDVGSYCGIFSRIARERGYDVTGVEPSAWAASYARGTLGIPTITGTVESIPAGIDPFDVICSWDVLEHVSDPKRELVLLNQRLRPGGIFAFSTLDYGNWYPRLLGQQWPWLMDMHLYYFDQKVMKRMLEDAGFRLVHARNYCHIISVEYLFRKLAALGVPGADSFRELVGKTPLGKVRVPFRFGDIRLYVCEKVAEAAPPISLAERRAAR